MRPPEAVLELRIAHALTANEVADQLSTSPSSGLSADEAASRLLVVGPNRVRAGRRTSYVTLFLHQFVDPLVLLLVAATAVSLAIGDVIEATAIATVLLLNGLLGFWQEASAEQAMAALSGTVTRQADVIRGGEVRTIVAEELVPGDLLLLHEGERIAADGRVVTGHGLEVDESALTGESLPVAKAESAADSAAPLAERPSMVYAGTAVTRGRGKALVCATGDATELGQVGALATAAKPPPSPLARRLGTLTRQMTVAGVAITVCLTVAMLARGESAHDAFLVGVAVAVAAVPEGLVATVTASLALGARAMARRGAIVRKLEAIETLGETTVICTDKTGTLTENRIRVAGLRPAPGVSERDLLVAAVLASSPRAGEAGAGDPIERALVLSALERGVGRDDVMAERHFVREVPFDSTWRRMTVVYDEEGGQQAYSKGAPEAMSRGAEPELDDAALAWASEGFRVLAVAREQVAHGEAGDGGELLGVIALHDPLRESAAQSLAVARGAGIGVRMLTGDHPDTARTIGRALGLETDAIVARATPSDKLHLVEDLQHVGEVVTVTGDGVNDAPALRRADVGVAMGRSGTEAAREAAGVVLTDDDIATVVAAVEEGRRIGDNIRTFVAFLLSANLGEVLVFAIAIPTGWGAPLAVVQVLLVNLVTDGLPALALARDPASPRTMTTPPRRGSELFDRGTWLALGGIGAAVGTVTLVAYRAGLALDDEAAQSMAFTTLALAELALVFGIRSWRVPAWRVPSNRWLGWSVAGAVVVVGAIVYAPWAQEAFATVTLGARELGIAVCLALVPLAALELGKALARRRDLGRAEE